MHTTTLVNGQRLLVYQPDEQELKELGLKPDLDSPCWRMEHPYKPDVICRLWHLQYNGSIALTEHERYTSWKTGWSMFRGHVRNAQDLLLVLRMAGWLTWS